MEKCNVTFTCESGQKIVCDFVLMDNGDLDFKPRLDPIADMRTNLGLAGWLLDIFIKALNKPENKNNDN